MSFFKKVATTQTEQVNQDTIGGAPITSGVYPASIVCAYGITSSKGAQGVTIEFKITEGTFKDRKFVSTQYVTNRNGENYYAKDGKNYLLPGFMLVDALVNIVTEGGSLLELEAEDRFIKVYDSEKGAEVEKQVPMFVDLLGTELQIGVLRKEKYKTTQDSQGNYVDTDEIRQVTELDKVFDIEGFTVTELENQVSEPKFIQEWLTRNENTVVPAPKKKAATSSAGIRNRSAGATPTAGGRPGLRGRR